MPKGVFPRASGFVWDFTSVNLLYTVMLNVIVAYLLCVCAKRVLAHTHDILSHQSIYCISSIVASSLFLFFNIRIIFPPPHHQNIIFNFVYDTS